MLFGVERLFGLIGQDHDIVHVQPNSTTVQGGCHSGRTLVVRDGFSDLLLALVVKHLLLGLFFLLMLLLSFLFEAFQVHLALQSFDTHRHHHNQVDDKNETDRAKHAQTE